jgi:hypothetical protein
MTAQNLTINRATFYNIQRDFNKHQEETELHSLFDFLTCKLFYVCSRYHYDMDPAKAEPVKWQLEQLFFMSDI